MELGLIIFLILICASMLYLARNHFGKIFSIISFLIFIMMILSAVGTFLIVKDLSKLKNDILYKKSTFEIKDEQKTYSAISILPTKDNQIGLDNIEYYNITKIAFLDQNIKNNKFDENNGRIFVIEPEVLRNDFELDIGMTLDQDDMINIIKSEDPYGTLAKIITTKKNVTGLGLEYAISDIKELFGPDEKLKGYFTAALVINYFTKGKPIANDLKEGKIEILPSTIAFQLIKHTPLPTFE